MHFDGKMKNNRRKIERGLGILPYGNSHTQIEISNDRELPKTTVNTVIKEIQKNGYVDLIPI